MSRRKRRGGPRPIADRLHDDIVRNPPHDSASRVAWQDEIHRLNRHGVIGNAVAERLLALLSRVGGKRASKRSRAAKRRYQNSGLARFNKMRRGVKRRGKKRRS